MLRRYTPPTCTLEINAKESPISRWAGQPVLKNLTFALHFDDPRLPDEKRKIIQGDRSQLELLCDVVSTYVQNFLEQSPMPEAIVQDAETFPSPEEKIVSLPVEMGGLHLKPKGLLAHHLFLGKLATEETGPIVDLSALQLFDLATALDDYATEVVALPNLNRPRKIGLPIFKNPPSWAGTAAAMLLAVGLTTAAIKIFDQPEPTSDAAKPLISSTPIAQATPTPLPTVTPLPLPSLSPAQPLPPPPSGVPTPPKTSIQTAPVAPPAARVPVAPIPNRQITVRPRTTVPPVPSNITPTPRPVSPAPQTTQTPRLPTTPPPLPSLPSLSSNAPQSKVETAPSVAAARRAPESADAARNNADTTLFDNIPQVGEARRFFQQRWRPPQGLTQTLEYNLLLNEDGTIQRIIPLGEAARTNVDRSGIPLLGEPFVSPIPGGRTPNIRVVLSPDGKVQTFLDRN